jgi:hypothetical protein
VVAGSGSLASDDRRKQRVYVEQDEVLVGPEPDGFDQPGIDTGQLAPFDDGGCRHLEEVEHGADSQAVVASFDLENDDRALIGRTPLLLEQQMSIQNGKEAATDVHQPFDRVRHARNSGSREAREDLTHDPCRGRADNLTDSKYDGVERGRVSHLY